VLVIFTKIVNAAGVKEAELHGSSSAMRANAGKEAAMGEM
jgi:hypothetical protein